MKSQTYIIKPLMFASLLLGATACYSTGNVSQNSDNIQHSQARFAAVSQTNEFRACVNDGLNLDKQAQQTGSAAQYLASAKLLEKCETAMQGNDSAIEAERMRALALSVQNYIKGGDVAKAASQLAYYKSQFSGKDLYFADGSAFSETMSLLIGEQELLANANVSQSVKSEESRIRYWEVN